MKDREAWHAAVHGVTKSQAWLHDWTAAIDHPLWAEHCVEGSTNKYIVK